MNAIRPQITPQFGTRTLAQPQQTPVKFGEIYNSTMQDFAKNFRPLKVETKMNETQLTQILDAATGMVDRICQAFENTRRSSL